MPRLRAGVLPVPQSVRHTITPLHKSDMQTKISFRSPLPRSRLPARRLYRTTGASPFRAVYQEAFYLLRWLLCLAVLNLLLREQLLTCRFILMISLC